MLPDTTIGDSRPGHSVLVTDAQTMAAIGVIRSLGRAGYSVHACAAQPEALGLFSKYTLRRVIHPPYKENTFLFWLRKYIEVNRITALVPCTEEFMLAIRECFEEFAPLLPTNHNSRAVFSAFSKFDLFELLLRVGGNPGKHIPPTLFVRDLNVPPPVTELTQLGLPVYLKLDALYSTTGRLGFTERYYDPHIARSRLIELSSEFDRALVQGHVAGQGIGAFFLLWNGELVADFMHRRIHEVPYTGGVSSLRGSWWHDAIRADALEKAKALNYQGVVMLEYRWNGATDQFWLMEMNARFWGSLHLPIFANVDFPKLLADCFYGRVPLQVLGGGELGVRCRWTFPKDVQYVWSVLNDRRLPLAKRLWPILEFIILSFDPTIHSDLWFPGDRLLYWRRLAQFLRSGA